MASSVRSSTAPFHGRERELAQLEAALEEAAAGRGRVFLLGGEPGIGKSRLIDEVSARAAAAGAEVLWGRCWEAGGAPPKWPWVQSIRAYVRHLDPASLAEHLGSEAADIAQMMPELRARIPGLAESAALDPESARFRLFDSTTAFLRRAAESQPLLLILDDLHAADTPSLLLLRFLCREIDRSRLLVVAAYRDTEMGTPLREAVADALRQRRTTQIVLSGLTEPQVAAVIRETAGSEPTPELAAAVYKETEGNPLFVGEIVRLLAAEGTLERATEEGAWTRVLPETVREVISLRLGRLSERCREILALASVLGREFDLDPLARSAGGSRAQVLSLLEEAVRARVVTETPGSVGRMRFSHALVRDALYGDLGPTERIGLHGRVAQALEEAYASDPEPHLAELAHHFFRGAPGRDPGTAVEYARRAGARAAVLLAYEEAVRLYGMALEATKLGGAGDEVTRCDLLLDLGDAQARAGEAVDARRTFLSAAEIATKGGMAERLARAALGYGGRFVWEASRGDPQLLTLLQDALAALGEADSELGVRVRARLAAGPLRDRFEREPRDALSAEAVHMARRLGDAAALAWALDGRYAAVWWPENLEDRQPLAAELVRVSREAGDKERELQGHHYLCLCLLERGDMAGVRDELESKRRLAEELRQPAQLWYLEAVRATLATFEGRFAEAEQLVESTFALGERAERAMAVIYRAIGLYMLRREQDRLEEVEEPIRRGAHDFPTYFVLRCVLAQVCTELGRDADARHIFENLARDDFGTLPRNDEWLFGMCLLAEVAASLGDTGRASTLYGLLLPYAGRNAVAAPEGCTGSISRNLGILSTVLRRWDDAVRHFDDALGMNERMGARPWAAHTRHAYARMLLARRAEDDAERAIDLLLEAMTACRELGMVALHRRCAEALRGEGVLAVEPERRVRRTFMFTDIVRSTVLLEAIGDAAWESLRGWHDRTLRRLFEEHGGTEVDHAGDGFFVSFSGAGEAVRCAVDIQRRLADHRQDHGFAPQVRIGLHTAEATEGDDGYSGKGVHEAARIAGLAEGGQILASRDTLEEAGPLAQRAGYRSVTLRGIPNAVPVGSVDWRAEG